MTLRFSVQRAGFSPASLLFFLAVSAFAACKPETMQIFLLIGQSNMAGRGIVEEQDRKPIPNVFSLNQAMQWVPAIDPLHFDKPKIAGVGMGRSFAQALAERSPGVKIGLVPAAFGGTSLDQWKPEGPLYIDAVKRARFAMQSGPLQGILWHQGESDSGSSDTAHSYAERWTTFATRLRSDLHAAGVPILVGALGPFLSPTREPFASVVNNQLESLPKQIPNVTFISAAGLRANPDNLHFDARSQRDFGRRYAAAYLLLRPGWPCFYPQNATILPQTEGFYRHLTPFYLQTDPVNPPFSLGPTIPDSPARRPPSSR